jgi:alpha/beta superfamily hydrolase
MILDEKETKLIISGPVGQLDAVLTNADSGGVLADKHLLVIICHPHPQQGGTMDNKVVTTLMRTYRDLGVKVMRFNFRGVGKSEGVFDNSVGELDDLLAIVGWVKNNLQNHAILLAGFSFGSSIAARASYYVDEIVHLTLVAPPVERYAYDRDGFFTVPVCIVQGDQDDLVNANGVYAWAETLRGPVALIRYPAAGHFFHGCLSTLKADLTEKLLTQINPTQK